MFHCEYNSQQADEVAQNPSVHYILKSSSNTTSNTIPNKPAEVAQAPEYTKRRGEPR